MLISLIFIILTDENKIKACNGGVFQKLTKLTDVFLQGNVCISELFRDPTKIAAMPVIVSQLCGFNEIIMELLEHVLKEQKSNIKEMQDRFDIAVNTIKDRCDMTVKTTQERYDSQLSLFKDLGDRLEMQCNKTMAVNTKEIIDAVNLKTCKIEILMLELKTKNEEIDEKNLKIKNLEERVKILDGLNRR